MSILTSILLLVAGITLLIVLLRARPKTRIRRLEEREQEKLEIGANICHAAARDAFAISLDRTLGSLEVLDRMIEQGWPLGSEHESATDTRDIEDTTTEKADAEDALAVNSIPDEQFVVGCYVGSVIVNELQGEWRVDSELHRWPYIYFSRADLAVSPFELTQKKFEAPSTFALAEAVERLTGDIDRRTNVRATTWHNAGEERVSFGEPTQHSE